MLRKKISKILYEAQQSTSCHQKYRQLLINLYKKTDFEDFQIEFMRIIEILFSQDVQHKNMKVERSVEFLATFVTTLVQNMEETHHSQSVNPDDIPMHPFLTCIIHNILQYHNLDYISTRYRSCQFINLLLRHLGDDAHIDVDIGNAIQNAMLERIVDIKPTIRLQAVKALVRLQQPDNIDCPVINALLGRIYDTNAMIRKEIVESIAATPLLIPKIVERVKDIDYTVRLAAFRKCSLIGPKMISITNRQLIVDSGFNDQNETVKNCFLEDTLPKWLSAYDGNYLKLFQALKLDAFEEDLQQTEFISKKVLEVFFKSHQISSIIEYLPIDETKLIPLLQLCNENALYWRFVTNYLRESDKADEYTDSVVPELVHFCNYIERYFKEMSKKILLEWQYLEYQYILCQLFKIVKEYDLSDEVGRQALYKLSEDMLRTGKFNDAVITEIVDVLYRINPVLDSLTIDICHIISDIREPTIEQPPSEEAIRQNDFKIAELRVKINILQEEIEEAIVTCNFETASANNKLINKLNEQVEELVEKFNTAKVATKIPQNDPETLGRCLEIFIGILSHPKMKTLTASLRSCKDEFVVPLLEKINAQIYSKVYRCVALCCLLDRAMAIENLKLICTPILMYRFLPSSDRLTLMIAIGALSDLLRIFGVEIFGKNDQIGSTSEQSQDRSKRRLNNGTRRLYTITQLSDIESFDFDSIAYEEILEILLDLLDEESRELRECSCTALCKLIMDGIAVSPSIITRLLLKWFNPVTEKEDPKLQQLLGNTLVSFARYIQNSGEILEKSIIPTLTSVAKAPRTSPIADIDHDSILRFLSAITSIDRPSEFANTHKNLAYALCYKISTRPEDRSVSLYVKMLLHLQLVIEDSVVVQELISHAQLASEDVTDKVPKRGIQKFIGKLKLLLTEIDKKAAELQEQGGSNVRQSLPLESVIEEDSSMSILKTPIQSSTPNKVGIDLQHLGISNVSNIEKTLMETGLSELTLQDNCSGTSVKRRKQRGRNRKPIRSFDSSQSEGNLSVISESVENQIDLQIEMPTTSSSSSSSTNELERIKGKLKKVVVSETSSDSEAPQMKTLRKSSRKKNRR